MKPVKEQQQIIIADSKLFQQFKEEIIESIFERLSAQQTPTPKSYENLLTTKEACAYLRISLSTLNRQVRQGMPYIQKNRKRFFKESALTKWLNA